MTHVAGDKIRAKIVGKICDFASCSRCVSAHPSREETRRSSKRKVYDVIQS